MGNQESNATALALAIGYGIWGIRKELMQSGPWAITQLAQLFQKVKEIITSDWDDFKPREQFNPLLNVWMVTDEPDMADSQGGQDSQGSSKQKKTRVLPETHTY